MDPMVIFKTDFSRVEQRSFTPMKSLKELSLEAVVENSDLRLRSLPQSLRREINLKRLPTKMDLLREKIVPHYCWMVDPKLTSPTQLMSGDRWGPCGKCDVVPPVEFSRSGHINAGFVYDPKKFRKNQTILRLCHVSIRTHPDGDSMRMTTDCFLSQGRLRQLQSLLLPLVKSVLSEGSAIDELDPPERRWKFKFNYWNDHRWDQSLFERIEDQVDSPKKLSKSLRKKVNQIRFERLLTRPEKVQWNLFNVSYSVIPEERLTDAKRTTLITHENNFWSHVMHTSVPLIKKEGETQIRDGFFHLWNCWNNERTVLKVCQMRAKYRETHYSHLRIETSPTVESLRRLQTLLIPLIRPYVRQKDLPFDRTWNEISKEKEKVKTSNWDGFLEIPKKWPRGGW